MRLGLAPISTVLFLGEGVAATSPPYPTPGWATTQVYPAREAFLVSP